MKFIDEVGFSYAKKTDIAKYGKEIQFNPGAWLFNFTKDKVYKKKPKKFVLLVSDTNGHGLEFFSAIPQPHPYENILYMYEKNWPWYVKTKKLDLMVSNFEKNPFGDLQKTSKFFF